MQLFLIFLLNELLFVILLSINRFSLLLRYAPAESLTLYKQDLIPAFERGLRFDFKVAAFIFLPSLVLSLIYPFLKKKALFNFNQKLIHFLWIASLLIIMLDQQYYAFFQSHINVLIFGLAEDDTSAVLQSAWSDHPVLRWLVIVALTFYLVKYLNKKFIPLSKKWTLSSKQTALLFAVYIPTHVLLMRGSITSPFPLQRDDIIVSNHPFINYLVNNPFFAIKEAIQEKGRSSTYVPENKILSKYNMPSIDEALNLMGKKNWDELFSTSPKNTVLEKKPPHLVYVMMESWSGFLFDYHNQENNFLSTLEPHVKSDFLFRNVISSATSTLPAMEGMLTGKEIRDVFIWNSPFRFNPFPSAIAQIYKDKGYRTVFITSGKMGWRNLNQWVPKQGFSEQYGQNDILSRYTDAQDCAWGVYDEYSFRLAKELLDTEKEKPLFIFVMTTSNHTPYDVPTHFKALPNNIPDKLGPSLTTSVELAQKSLIGYQYANKSLGDFITDVKSSDTLKEKTLVMAIGDHSSWMLSPRNSEIMSVNKALSVPLYFYVPEYLKTFLHYDPSRAASHKDILSTLIPATLSEARYLNLGNNLFSAEKKNEIFFGLNSDSQPFKILTTSDSDLSIANKKSRAYLALNHIYFQREFCKMESSWCK